MSLATPTIHLNGTSADALLNDHLEMLGLLRHAVKAMCEGSPHGRDYYPQGPDAIVQARDQHYQRVAKINQVIAELEAIALAISVQQ